MNEDSSISIVLTPVQLAAVLQGESISNEATLSNRLWGTLTLVGGVAEMAGGAILCALPEPSGASKAGCILLGAHGIDSASTGLRELWTGRQTRSLTELGLAELASKLGAGPGSGQAVGIVAEIGVPAGFAGAIRAARVSSIVAGRISLSRHEASVFGGLGGHTLAQHVGKTKAFLEERLRNEPWLRRASTFHSVDVAESAVTAIMRRDADRIHNWATSATEGAWLRLSDNVTGDLGVVLARGATELVQGTKVVLVLKKRTFNGMPYFILTAYLDI
ncbi:RNase A-like domain-containing protein [Achromobacter sp. NFACC18-2]|uniref:RNase A-like domain-containing protein n=1 Tax=Achromobacter sp. NFACC18-2 TaxID=1564112 RepID=UPI0008CE08F2|nr:RNase A-like domain-containing protein [Achromobacter sp. NFACC18-2]SEK12768.1 hypothetical protein SAMN03159494_05701 [Achromobacter sp. NFACC18-2]